MPLVQQEEMFRKLHCTHQVCHWHGHALVTLSLTTIMIDLKLFGVTEDTDKVMTMRKELPLITNVNVFDRLLSDYLCRACGGKNIRARTMCISFVLTQMTFSKRPNPKQVFPFSIVAFDFIS